MHSSWMFTPRLGTGSTRALGPSSQVLHEEGLKMPWQLGALASRAEETKELVIPTSRAPPAELHEKLISASVGALLTSLVTNPLDVVKTRLQVQPAHPGTAGLYVCACGLNIPRTYTSGLSSGYRGTLDALVKITRMEGLGGLYRGMAPSLVMAVPSTVLYYSLYDTLRQKIQAAGVLPLFVPLLGGSMARLVAATATAPLELIRTRAQAETTTASGMVKTAVEIIREGGVRSLWYGLGPQLWRDVPFSAIYWQGYETISASLGQDASERSDVIILKSLIAGVGAGSMAALATTPFDVVKTRRQVLTEAHAGQAGSTLVALRQLWAAEGLAGLFEGAVPRVLRIGPACAIMMSTYEGGKHLFHRMKDGEGDEDIRP